MHVIWIEVPCRYSIILCKYVSILRNILYIQYLYADYIMYIYTTVVCIYYIGTHYNLLCHIVGKIKTKLKARQNTKFINLLLNFTFTLYFTCNLSHMTEHKYYFSYLCERSLIILIVYTFWYPFWCKMPNNMFLCRRSIVCDVHSG